MRHLRFLFVVATDYAVEMTETPPLMETERRIADLRERLLLAPHDQFVMCDLATALEEAGDIAGAIDLYQRALRVDPYNSVTLLRLGEAWAALGENDRARGWFERALSVDPECGSAAMRLHALQQGNPPTEAFIRTLFDQYAPRFDRELTETLRYRAPDLVVAAVMRTRGGAVGLDILDLGCGTGLSGAALLPLARRLDGVDLSSGMIEQANTRGIYNSLAVSEVHGFLSDAENLRNWDVIAAVDVLNYVGDLAQLFRLASGRLKPGGILVGTVERADSGVVLTHKRRYAHGRDHLESAAAAAALTLTDCREEILRTEAGIGVQGLIFTVR